MRWSLLALTLLVGLALPAARAATMSCPELDTAVQVGACPAEEALQSAFTGRCGGGDVTAKDDPDVCSDYLRYRKLKNVARWEAADGVFNADLSCDLPTLGVRQARVAAVKLVKQGKITLLVCNYADGVSFIRRTRAKCQLEAPDDCVSNPAGCRARCN